MRALLSVRLFGHFQLFRDGQSVALGRRKSEALLAYLILHPGPQQRERIAAQFWGGSSDEDARRSLRVILADLRKSLGEDLLVGERDTIAIERALIADIDTDSFSALAQLPQARTDEELAGALNLYRDDLLRTLDDDWLRHPRAALREAMQGAALCLLERLRAGGNYKDAIAQARALLRLDPANESAHQHLIFCLAASGQRDAAVQQFANCSEAMQEHLGVAPGAATLALYEGIVKQHARAPAARLGNLPRPMTSFVGRDDELNAIQTLLTQTRGLTLLGSGGSGKTRLAIQAADEVAHLYAGGVWWVDLSALGDARQVVPALAHVLGVHESGAASLLQLTAAFIGAQHMLIVLDNCEHLRDACAACVEHLLLQCPALTVLATSREALLVNEEVKWQVPPMPVPGAGADFATLRENDALRLFAERARPVQADFVLDTGNAAQIASICRRLEGIPLAIELAATQLGQFDPGAIDAGLTQALAMAGAALRGTMEWSFELLNRAEQTLFRRLSVFTGGCTLAAATVVAGGFAEPQAALGARADDDAAALAALPVSGELATALLLEGLVRKSLVQLRRGEAGLRYAMLDTLHAFAVEKQAAAADGAALRQAHHAFFLALAERCEPALWGSGQAQAMAALDQDSDNLHAAIDGAQGACSAHQALRLGTALCRYWLLSCDFSMSMARLERLVQPQDPECAPLRALAYYWICDFGYRCNRGEQAAAAAQTSLHMFEQLGDLAGQARALRGLGMAACLAGQFDAAASACERGLQMCHALGDARGIANIATLGGEITRWQQRYPESRSYNEQALAIYRQLGDARAAAISVLNLGLLSVAHDDPRQGAAQLLEAGAVMLEVGERHHLTYVFDGLGYACQRQQRLDEAARLYGALHAYCAATKYALFGPDGPIHEARLQALRAAMPAERFELAWQAGAALSEHEAARYALAFSLD
ncbi:MAG: BTAD domain-containing putative transcriptional regulator [Pseudomonadota bacterium]